MKKIFFYDEINIRNIVFSDNNYNVVPLLYKDTDNCLYQPIIKLPKLYCYDSVVKKETKYSICELYILLNKESYGSNNKNSYESDNKECENNSVLSFFYELDQFFLEYGKLNKNKYHVNKYKSLIRYYNSHKFFKIKFLKTPDVTTEISSEIDDISEPNIDSFHMNTIVDIYLEITAVWFKDNIYGTYYKLHKIDIVDCDHYLQNNDIYVISD